MSGDLRDDLDFSNIKTDIYIGASALIGGGGCAMTLGLGCAIGVGVAAEIASISNSQLQYNDDKKMFHAGLLDVQKVRSSRDDRDLTLYLKPLAIVGEGVGSTVRVTKGIAKRVGKTGKKSVRTSGGKRKGQRRLNDELREEISNIEKGLSEHKEIILSKYYYKE